MGLHLCYELALPRETPATLVAERVRLLYEAAARLPCEKLSACGRGEGPYRAIFEHPEFEVLEPEPPANEPRRPDL